MPSDARSASRRLLRAARPLRPEQAPYYVHNPRPGVEQGPGWYWTPAGASGPVYLAYNADLAAVQLLLLAREADANMVRSALGALEDDQADDEPAPVAALSRPLQVAA